MRLRFNQFLALAGLTALETVRQPIALILVATTVAFIGVLPLVLTHTMGEAERLVRDSAMALHFVSGLILGGYAACSSLAHEIRSGTASAVLSKPVYRGLFFLAKYAGIAVIMLLYSGMVTLATLLSVRTVSVPYIIDQWSAASLLIPLLVGFLIAGLLNYGLRRPYCSNAFFLTAALLAASFVAVNFIDNEGHAATFGEHIAWNLLPVGALVAMGILVLTAFAVSLSTRLDTLATLSICGVIFLVGLMSDYLFGRFSETSTVGAVLYGLVPNWQHFWVVDALTAEHAVPLHYMASAGLYGGCYLAAVLSLGLLSFRTVEVSA